MKSPCFYLLTFFFFFTSSEFECFPIYLVLVRENYIFCLMFFRGWGEIILFLIVSLEIKDII